MIGQISVPENADVTLLKGLLKESENRFNLLADASPIMIWMTDEHNQCYYFNKSWTDFTGRNVAAEAGTAWLQGVHPDDLKLFNTLEPILDRKEKYTFEYRLLRHDGQYRFIHEIGNPRFLPDGTFAGYIGSCIDVTEARATEVILANQAKELMRSNEELEQFAYVASHDLQEPLRMILSYVQLIQKNIDQGDTKRVNEFIAYVIEGTGRMQALINDLLQFSRVTRKGNPFAQVDLNEVLKIAVTHLTARIQENNAQVNISPMPVIMGDSFQLIRLFQNLIDNAIKFKTISTNPIIDINVKEKEDEYEFSVRDNGIGIEDKFYNRIFVIFQRLHNRKDYEGTGIGLAICKKIVERHGGEIWVESEKDKGSTFYFTIKK